MLAALLTLLVIRVRLVDYTVLYFRWLLSSSMLSQLVARVLLSGCYYIPGVAQWLRGYSGWMLVLLGGFYANPLVARVLLQLESAA